MQEGDLLDDRFRSLLSDPKFKKPRKHDRKIKIDKRFQSMFKKDSFKVKYTVDKRGRPVSKSSTEDFKKFYDLSSDEDEKNTASEESSAEESGSEEGSVAEGPRKKSDFPTLLEDEKHKKQITRDIRDKLMDMNVDYARGEGKLFSDSSSDESESEESEDDDLYHEWNELDKDAEITHEISNRLAICNMDWDRIRAVDLMMLLNSFLPSGSLVNSVAIFPSEYGLKRLQEEEVNGPAELVDTNPISDSDNDENEDEGKHFHMERMRKYQLNRLRYYYAIATFDSPETADYVYTNCNGVEYESSGIRLDLRFVDDDTTFDQEPKDVCNSTNNYQNYQPRSFTNTALQQAKVELTWDETDPKRAEFTQKMNEAAKKGEINDSDLEDYVALSSSGEEDEQEGEKELTFEATMSDNDSQSDSENSEDDDPITTYRKLLQEIEENKKADREDEEELEISWGTGEERKTILKKESAENKSNDDLTPFERLIEKKKEKSKLRKIKIKKHDDVDDAIDSDKETKKSKKKKKKKKPMSEEEEKQKQELELLLMEEDSDNKHHFSLKKILENESGKKKKKLKKKKLTNQASNDDFQVDVKDVRFSAIYSSHLFNIDPTNPKFTKTKGMGAFITEKQKRIAQNDNIHKDFSQPATTIQKTSGEISSELSSLVQSVKSKSNTMLPKNKYKKRK